jgi:hypothetical protein
MKNNGPSGPGNYLVGKGRPPLSTRWKPGQSGNPNGRPRGTKNMTTHFRHALSRKIDIKEVGKSREVTVREAIALNTTNLALKKGDTKLILFLLSLDREITAELEREEIEIRLDMTPKEALEAYQRTIIAATYGPPPRGKK